ncbi:helix-turn-helix domain-containing protein [Scytonema sp. HK-05]|uniref:helix-turn-helix domain-containing protein n=1 Tax=Scytonema sp. HK-05 TaxID=1137095 RepID=UPI001160F560
MSTQEIAENTNLRKGTINRHLKYLVESNVLEVLKELTFYLYRISDDQMSEVKKQLEHLKQNHPTR